VSVSALGLAPGIADAERVGASAKAQAANPVNKSRFMVVFSPWIALRDKEESFGASKSSIFGIALRKTTEF
jgi:hypothetical protein